MPLIRPVMVALVPTTVGIPPAGLEVTVYAVMALPPSDNGADHETLAWVSPAVAETAGGAPGAVATASGVTLFDAAEAGLLPLPFSAVTENVYAVPLTRPVTVTVVSGAITAVTAVVAPAGLEVTVKPVIGLLPVIAGKTHETVA